MKSKLFTRLLRNAAAERSNAVLPGSDLSRDIGYMNISESTIRRYVKFGWLKRVGTGLVLTREGYRNA